MDTPTPESLGLVQPHARLSLKVAVDGLKEVWITSTPENATTLINECDARLVSFTQVRGMKGYPFSTRPDNIANVSDVS